MYLHLFQLSGFYIVSLIEIRKEGNTVKVERQNRNKRGKHIKPGHLVSALGYGNSLESLLAGISVMPNSVQFKS